jgi:hypothetical protein
MYISDLSCIDHLELNQPHRFVKKNGAPWGLFDGYYR